jgi:hypothetical protein
VCTTPLNRLNRCTFASHRRQRGHDNPEHRRSSIATTPNFENEFWLLAFGHWVLDSIVEL